MGQARGAAQDGIEVFGGDVFNRKNYESRRNSLTVVLFSRNT